MSLQVSVHNNCRWAGPERFHIRVRLEDTLAKAFVDKVAQYGIGEDHYDRLRGAWFMYSGKKFHIEDGEYDPRDEGGFVYFSVTVDGGSIQADFTPYQGGWNIDFSLEKIYGDDRDLDQMKWLDTGIEHELPECFWVEPASIIRAIIQH